VGNPKSIIRQCGASVDDMNVLLAKRYVLQFESGVIVIKHWKINNYLRNDRTHDTTYLEERDTLLVDERGAYTEKPEFKGNSDCGIPTDNQVVDKRYTENRLDKNRLDKNNIYSVHFEEFWKNYPRKKEKANANKCYQARLRDGFSEEQLLEACINYAADCEVTKREERYIKLGATFLSASTPFVDYLNENYTPAKATKKSSFETENKRTYDYDALMKSVT